MSARGILRDPAVLVAAVTLAFIGAATAATLPYESLVAIDVIGLSPFEYSSLVVAFSILSTAVGLSIGYISDHAGDRRLIVASLAAIAAFSYIVLYFQATPIGFYVGILFGSTCLFTSYQQIFAHIREHASGKGESSADFGVSLARTVYAGAWVVVPALIGVYVASGQGSLITIYLFSALACLVCASVFAALVFKMVPPRENRVETNRIRQGYFRSLSALASPYVAKRLLFLGVIGGSLKLGLIILSLVLVSELGASESTVGFLAGVTAAVEIPFMIGWGIVLRWLSKSTAIVIASMIYGLYLCLLAVSQDVQQVYLLMLLNALGASALLSLPISYVQVLLRDRPGLGSALISVTSLLGSAVAALVFSVGAETVGYRGVAVAAGALSIMGGVGLLVANIGEAARARRGGESEAERLN